VGIGSRSCVAPVGIGAHTRVNLLLPISSTESGSSFITRGETLPGKTGGVGGLWGGVGGLWGGSTSGG
tara:strand:+ start:237 stop:440 length:204 start_codon:yes stop_codon:yes gene_type:complete